MDRRDLPGTHHRRLRLCPQCQRAVRADGVTAAGHLHLRRLAGETMIARGFGAAAVLLAMVLVLFALARVFRRPSGRRAVCVGAAPPRPGVAQRSRTVQLPATRRAEGCADRMIMEANGRTRHARWGSEARRSAAIARGAGHRGRDADPARPERQRGPATSRSVAPARPGAPMRWTVAARTSPTCTASPSTSRRTVRPAAATTSGRPGRFRGLGDPLRPDRRRGLLDAKPQRGFAYSDRGRGTSFCTTSRIGNKRVTNLRLSGDVNHQDLHSEDHQLGRPGDQGRQPWAGTAGSQDRAVVRSDGSGTTAQLTAWMANHLRRAVDDDYCHRAGRNITPCGFTSFYPITSDPLTPRRSRRGWPGSSRRTPARARITYVRVFLRPQLRLPRGQGAQCGGKLLRRAQGKQRGGGAAQGEDQNTSDPHRGPEPGLRRSRPADLPAAPATAT